MMKAQSRPRTAKAAKAEVVRKSWASFTGACRFNSGPRHHTSSLKIWMKEKVVSIQQIKEAKRLHRALEITTLGQVKVTLSEMLEKITEMDRQSELELADMAANRSEARKVYGQQK